MTIKEAIAHEKRISKLNDVYGYENNVNYHKQIEEWLEELVMFRLESCMIHMPERLHLVENTYNKAIDDFVELAKEYNFKYVKKDVSNFIIRFIEFFAEQLKAEHNITESEENNV